MVINQLNFIESVFYVLLVKKLFILCRNTTNFDEILQHEVVD